MSANPTPHAFPSQMRDSYTTEMYGIKLDANTAFIVRRLIAEAYALGYQNGRGDQQAFDRTDKETA